MNTTTLKWIPVGLIAAVALCGCVTTGYVQADKTGQGIADFRAEVLNLKKTVDESMAALDLTVETASTNPRAAFETFSASVGNVEAARNKVTQRAAAVSAAGTAYFKQWETELATISDPDTRELAQERKNELNATFAKLGPLVEEAKEEFNPLVTKLLDLRTFLSQDLTVGGVDAAKGLVKEVRRAGANVDESLDDLIAEMNSIAATLTASRPSLAPAGR